MREICVLGAGVAGLSFIKKVRSQGAQYKIRLIDNKRYSYNKREFISNLSVNDYFDLKRWAQDNDVEFIHDSVERVNPKRKKIYFKESDSIDFDSLIIATGLKSKKMSLKGEHREGFFYLSQMDPMKIKELLKVSCEISIYASSILGCKFARAINSLGKEVKVIADSWDFLGEDKDRMIAFFQNKGIDVYLESEICEAIGEAGVKAVKIAPLKVFSSQAVVIDSGFIPNADFFDESVNIKDVFFSNHEDLYFLGDVNCKNIEHEFFFNYNYDEAKYQGEVLGDFIVDENLDFFERKII
ncbi:MAG: NAD(P)/FAD-dependent oxidoreductase, partial [Candidatus Omnitrophota bacterium]